MSISTPESVSNTCPYCSLAKTRGEVFCSRHSTSMNDLESGVFFIQAKNMEECDWHITRLSLNFNFDGPQPYFAGNREYRVTPEKFLLINQGQQFKTSVKSEVDNRMVTLAFKVGLAEEIHKNLTHTADYLLDEPFASSGAITFFEKTYSLDDSLRAKILQMVAHPLQNTNDVFLDEAFENILTQLLMMQKDIHLKISSIDKVKASTRLEIYKRLNWALEFVNDHFQEDIQVDHLAAQSCLSSFHFKRLFKEFFNESPYQYIKRLRIEKSCMLLSKGYAVQEVCRAVGWKDPSSFVRLFKQTKSVTPARYAQKFQVGG
jgi:AraC family transcriptional regulator